MEAAIGHRDKVKIFWQRLSYADGTAVRDYVHVSDTAQAHLAALDYLNHGGDSGAFNIGIGKGFSVKEVLATAKTVSGVTLPRKTRRDGWATRRLRFVIRPRRNACWVFPRVIFRLSPCWNLPGLGNAASQFCQLMTSPGARPQTIFVAIPVYNGAPYIGQAIQSLISQSYPHWRLTVYDNASTDATREVVQSFSDDRITLAVIDKTVAVWDNWNRCLSEVKGDFFQLLCADDALHPSCFEKKIMLAEKPENAAITIFSSNRNLMSAKERCFLSSVIPADWGCFHAIMSSARLFPKPTPSATPPRGLRARRRLVISKVLALIIRSWWIWIFGCKCWRKAICYTRRRCCLIFAFPAGRFPAPGFSKIVATMSVFIGGG